MSTKVSILISCYNVEKFLNEGLACVVNQTHKNLEIILVNDGSTDGSGARCEAIARTDTRIKVFHKENGGLGSARNLGLEKATGDYVYFYDVDDRMELDLIERAVTIAEEKKVDLVMFGMYIYDVRYNQKDEIRFRTREIVSNEALKGVFADNFIFVKHGNGFVWNKLYRKSFIDQYHFRFGNLRIQQDEIFNMEIYKKIQRVYITDLVLYHYYLHPSGGAATRYFKNKFDIMTAVFDSFMAFCTEWQLSEKRIFDYIYNRYMSGIINVLSFNYSHPDCDFSVWQRYREIKKVLNHPQVVRCADYYCTISRPDIFILCVRYRLALGFMLLNDAKRTMKAILRRRGSPRWTL